MSLRSHKDLLVWQKSIELVKFIYQVTKQLPSEEKFGLVSQMRRRAISIPSNIAEGYKRKGTGEYVLFLSYAEGSAAELDTQLTIAELLYPETNLKQTHLLLEEVQKMLFVLVKKLTPKS